MLMYQVNVISVVIFSEGSRKKPLFLGGFAYHWHGGGGKRFELNVGHGSQFDRTEEIVYCTLSCHKRVLMSMMLS
jgi:hypothetical protein